MNKKSIYTKALMCAVKKGYTIDDEGEVFYKGKKRSLKKVSGYYCFTIRVDFDEKVKIVMAHRLQAYKKYGNKIFKKGVEVRHLDSNSLNNSKDNIGIGTPKQNASDKDKSVRMRAVLIATSFIRKHDHEKIIKLHKEGFSYKQIMEKLNIKSKGAISFAIRKSIKSNTSVTELADVQG